MKQQKRNSKSLHHIVGQKYKDKYNISEPENKIIITQKQHDAFNLIVGNKQSPKEQLQFLLEERWFPVLSEQVKQDIYNILSKPDKEFYLKKIVKG